jgi:TM2 domain-containing membrane protein YozV
MSDKTAWIIDEPERASSSRKKSAEEEADQRNGDRSPAVAFSLSLLFWGGGQIYNRQYALGILFIIFMANFYVDMSLVGFYWESMINSFKGTHIYPVALIGCGIFYILGLLFWIFNAFQSYRHASKSNGDTFQGVNSAFLPFICSLLIPGWGQFLNGQPKKGLCFLIFALVGLLIAVPFLVLVPVFWSSIETSNDKLLIEKGLIMAVTLLPFIALMWLVNLHDAVKVSLDPVKKEPFGKRIEYAINRFRMNGFIRSVITPGKRILMVSLFLVFLLTLCYHYFPIKQYTYLLQNLQVRLSQQGMVFVPDWLEKILWAADSQHPHR